VAKFDADIGAFSRRDVLKVRRRVLLTSWKGRPLIRKWPKQRGPVRSPLQKLWTDRFAHLARELKSVDPITLSVAQNMSLGTGWYYRDVLETAAYGKLIRYQDEPRVTTPTAKLTRLTNQQLTGGQFLFIPMTAALWDNNVFWSATLNPSRLTFKAPGLYLVGATIVLNTANAGTMAAELWHQGATVIGATRIPKNGLSTYLSVMGIVYVHANEYVELGIFNSANTTQYQVPNFWAVAITPEALIP